MKILKNTKFYKFDEDGNLSVIRLKRVKNKNCFVMYNEKEEFKLTFDELLQYTKLKPTGMISVSRVGLAHGLRDVVVCYYSRRALDSGEHLPDIVLRQNSIDWFYTGTKPVVGYCCPRNLVPPERYRETLLSNSIESVENIAYYIGDSIDDIFKKINLCNANALLKENKKKALEESPDVLGLCESVEELMNDNHFMFEVLQFNNIYQIPVSIVMNDKGEISLDTYDKLKSIFTDINSPGLIEYTEDINREEFVKKYYMISDKDYKLYILFDLI